MKKLFLLVVAACAISLGGCGPNSPYSDPGLPDRPNPHSGLGLYLPDHPDTRELRAGPIDHGADGAYKEFATGDESAILSAVPKRAPERTIQAPGRISEGRTILI